MEFFKSHRQSEMNWPSLLFSRWHFLFAADCFWLILYHNTYMPSLSICFFKNGFIFLWRRIISTGQPNSCSKNSFKSIIKKGLGVSVSMHTSISLSLCCWFLATEPNIFKERTPKSCTSFWLQDLINSIYSVVVFIPKSIPVWNKSINLISTNKTFSL